MPYYPLRRYVINHGSHDLKSGSFIVDIAVIYNYDKFHNHPKPELKVFVKIYFEQSFPLIPSNVAVAYRLTDHS